MFSIALLLLAGTGALGVAFAGQHRPSALDRWFLTHLAAPAGADPHVRTVLLLFTNPVLVYGAALVFALWCLRTRRHGVAAVAVCAPVLAVVCSSVLLKPVFGRLYGGYLSYPSGHTTLLLATLAVFVLARPPWLFAAVPLALIGAFGLVAGRYHYLTDTFGGAAVGTAISMLAWSASLLLSRRPWIARSAERSP